LNNVLFGNVHHNNGKWAVDEQRPQELTEIVGKNIEKNYKPEQEVNSIRNTNVNI